MHVTKINKFKKKNSTGWFNGNTKSKKLVHLYFLSFGHRYALTSFNFSKASNKQKTSTLTKLLKRRSDYQPITRFNSFSYHSHNFTQTDHSYSIS